jgi:hypothetical protein
MFAAEQRVLAQTNLAGDQGEMSVASSFSLMAAVMASVLRE